MSSVKWRPFCPGRDELKRLSGWISFPNHPARPSVAEHIDYYDYGTSYNDQLILTSMNPDVRPLIQ